MENEKLQQLLTAALKDIELSETSEDIANVRNKYLAKKSELSSMTSLIGTLPPEERKDFGAQIHHVKTEIEAKLEEKGKALQDKELEEKLNKETIDISLPGRKCSPGSRNPFYIVKDEMTDIFCFKRCFCG